MNDEKSQENAASFSHVVPQKFSFHYMILKLFILNRARNILIYLHGSLRKWRPKTVPQTGGFAVGGLSNLFHYMKH